MHAFSMFVLLFKFKLNFKHKNRIRIRIKNQISLLVVARTSPPNLTKKSFAKAKKKKSCLFVKSKPLASSAHLACAPSVGPLTTGRCLSVKRCGTQARRRGAGAQKSQATRACANHCSIVVSERCCMVHHNHTHKKQY